MNGTDMLAKAMAGVECDTGATTEDLLAALGLINLRSAADHHAAHEDLIELMYYFRQVAQNHGVELRGTPSWTIQTMTMSMGTWAEIHDAVIQRRTVLANWIERVDHGL